MKSRKAKRGVGDALEGGKGRKKLYNNPQNKKKQGSETYCFYINLQNNLKILSRRFEKKCHQ